MPEYIKLQHLIGAIKGNARFALNLDNTALYSNETAYSNIIRKLHQAYGKKSLTAEVASQIHGLKLVGKDKESHMAFVSELDNLTMLDRTYTSSYV